MDFIYGAFADESSNALGGQIDALKRNGYDYLEIRNIDGKNFTELTLEDAKEIKRELDDNGLRVWSLGSPIGKIDINGDFDAHIGLYKHTLELGNVFGAKSIRLFSFFMPKDENPQSYKNLVIERMGKIAEIAKAYGITPCHENEKGIYGDIATRCADIHKAIPEIKAVFDPANFVQSGQDTLKAWEELEPYIEYMHIKDALSNGVVVAPGKGIGNIGELLKKYSAKGGKVLTLEPHLYEFVGLKSLEREGDESIVGQMSFSTAEEAFDFAVDNLKELVAEI